jgi:hypothetical protein
VVRNAQRLGVRAAFVGIVAAEDRHIAAAAASLVDETPRRGARLKRRDHFQQDGIDRQQRIFQAILRDITVAVTDLQAHDVGNVTNQRLEMQRHQTDLPQSHVALA